MGVPKFFRYVSERYPCLSELVKEYQIPSFDNLYLDMNGIIHTCSHPDDSDTTFRITEEKIFQDIFHYIEILFRMIKPQKVFFMAVDGVAPRAKMNQQRGRRFRSAKDAERQEKEAKSKNIAIPDTVRFDSNCITPGTIFMTRLHEQLKYFVAHKITTDKLWQKCDVILSGHDTPGEGEHKIMDYIRYARSQPRYNPNTRHCLYGLDADLIMLGLCSHEPHFSLLREEVKFGRKSVRKMTPENTTFYLLHLSLMREYLREEFKPVAEKLSFKYDLESVIDDWVLMGFLVGNDFIPHLPNLHINSGGLPILYKTYMDVLPELDGYLNESGTINLPRFEKFMRALTAIDYKSFEDTYDDLQYFKSKTGHLPNTTERKSYKPRDLEAWETEEVDNDLIGCLEPDNAVFNKDLAALIKDTSDFAIDDPSEPSFSELNKIFFADDTNIEEKDMQIETEFQLHKKNYYETKMNLTDLTSDTLLHLSYEYIRALQWILNYYYNGVCSWSWFYPYHYSPYISDVKGYLNMEMNFDLSKPFLPYEQLLAVLPPASRDSLPKPFHALMTDPESPIKDFYPDNFETDLNGKQQEWEAVVLIPFIEENRLITAMALPLTHLSPEERARNSHGPMSVYRYSDENLGSYYAPQYFPPIHANHASCTPLTRESIYVPHNKLVKGICKRAAQGVYYPGFPTTKHLEYKSNLMKKKVRVFDQPSRDYNMILTIEPPVEVDAPKLCDIAAEYLGKTLFVRWPHLTEAKVVGVSNAGYRYDVSADGKGYNVVEHQGNADDNFKGEKSVVETYYLERRGIDVGKTSCLIHVRELVGRRYEFISEGKIRVNLAKEYAAATSTYPLQTIVKDIDVFDEHHSTYQDLGSLFQEGAICFMLGQPHYGATGKVLNCQESFSKGRVKVQMQVAEDPDFTHLYHKNNDILRQYYTQYFAATRLSLSNSIFARITANVLIGRGASKNQAFEDVSKANVGLNLKNLRNNMCIPGYVRNFDSKWYYSEKCLELVDSYRNEFFTLFQFLNNANSNQLPSEIEIFPEDKGDGTTLKKIQEWIKKQPHSSLEMQSCDSKALETEVVQELEYMISLHMDEVQYKSIKMTVRPHCIHIPGLIYGNISADNSATFELFDRVANMRECYTVPVGYTGTVIAVHKVANDTFTDEKKDKVLVDVLFDKSFVGGTSLNGCSPNRGYRMNPIDLINKTHGDRQLNLQLQKKTPNYQVYNPVQPQETSQSAFVTWNNCIQTKYTNNYHPNNGNYPGNHNNISPIRAAPIQTLRTPAPPPLQNPYAHVKSVNGPNPSVAYNSNNIPCYVPPIDTTTMTSHHEQKLPRRDLPGNTYSVNRSNFAQSIDNMYRCFKNTDANGPKKDIVPNKQDAQPNSPSKSPMRSVQMQVEPPVKERNAKVEQVIAERKPVSKQLGTEMLRSLLQTNEKENRKIDQNQTKASGFISVDDFFEMAQSSRSINPVQTTQPPTSIMNQPTFPPPLQSKDFPSAQLLSFFVAHGMGCPMYTYSRLQGGHKAEVQIPTNSGSNMIVISALCGSQNAATEDVAAKTLMQLKTVDLSIFMPEVPQIPNPPMRWCMNNQTTRAKSSTQDNSPSRSTNLEMKSPRQSEPIKRNIIPPLPTNRSGLNAASVPFVPLQVTRKHYEKSSGSAHVNTIDKNSTSSRNHEQNSSNRGSSHMKQAPEPFFQQVNISSRQQKPKGTRQMRLAANFSNMPS